MYQDYINREIEKLGLVLRELLLLVKSPEPKSVAVKIDEILEQEFGQGLAFFENADTAAVLEYIENTSFSEERKALLPEFLMAAAEMYEATGDYQKAKDLNLLALQMLEKQQEGSKTFSFVTENAIARLKEKLKD